MNLKESIASLIRAGLHMLAFYLVKKGLTDEQAANSFVDGSTEILLGFVVACAAFLWSILKHRFNEYLFREALNANPLTSPSTVKQRVLEKVRGVSPV